MTGEQQRIEAALRDLGGTPEGRRYAESVLANINPERRPDMTILPTGTVVHVVGYPGDTARVLGYGLCPEGCGRTAYTVKRQEGSFTSWLDDVGTWHAESTVPTRVAGVLLDLADQHFERYGDDNLVQFLRLLASRTRDERADLHRFAQLPVGGERAAQGALLGCEVLAGGHAGGAPFGVTRAEPWFGELAGSSATGSGDLPRLLKLSAAAY